MSSLLRSCFRRLLMAVTRVESRIQVTFLPAHSPGTRAFPASSSTSRSPSHHFLDTRTFQRSSFRRLCRNPPLISAEVPPSSTNEDGTGDLKRARGKSSAGPRVKSWAGAENSSGPAPRPQLGREPKVLERTRRLSTPELSRRAPGRSTASDCRNGGW